MNLTELHRVLTSTPLNFCVSGKWSKIPITTLLNFMDCLPRRVEAVAAAQGRAMSYILNLMD